MQNLMRPEHEQWKHFYEMLAEACKTEGCDSHSTRLAKRILSEHFPAINAAASVKFFQKNGGFCDCEILMNVESQLQELGFAKRKIDGNKRSLSRAISAGTDLNTIQNQQMQQMRSMSFNQFDGERVVDDLLSHRNLWTAAIMLSSEQNKLVALRETACGEVYVDTLYILAEIGRHEELKRLAEAWQPDEIKVISGDTSFNGLTAAIGEEEPARVAFRLWWD